MQPMEMFYKVVVQAVLMYRSEIWVIMDTMMKVLEGFQHLITQRIAGKKACQIGVECWECLPVEESLYAAGTCKM